jgi:protein-disulfide isomerase
MRSKAQRRTSDARRKRAAELRAQQARQERRRRRTVVGVVVLVVLALVVGVGVAVQAGRDSGGGTSAAPSGTTSDGAGFALGESGAPVTVEVYEDFLCPACRTFEEARGQTLAELVDAGTIRIVYRPIALLDRASTDRYSTRALNASACVADAAGTDGFVSYHERLFAEQPAEGGPGLPDDRLAELAAEAGAGGDDVGRCIDDLQFRAWAADVTDTASKAGVNGTPTVLVAGERVEVPTPENLRAAVERAAG